MDSVIKNYLSGIGRVGGSKSRRKLSAEQAKNMVRVREARRAYKAFHSSCFWSFDPSLQIGLKEVGWVASQLRKHGNRQAWLKAESLCR